MTNGETTEHLKQCTRKTKLKLGISALDAFYYLPVGKTLTTCGISRKAALGENTVKNCVISPSARYGKLIGMLWKTMMCVTFGLRLLAQGSGDEAAVRQVVQKYVDARESKDAHAIEALFTSDADQLVSTGEWRKGRAEVVRGTMASSQSSGGKRTITVTSVRFVAPGVAIADGRYEITGMADGGSRKMWASLTLARGPGGWQIAAIRNMLPAAQ